MLIRSVIAALFLSSLFPSLHPSGGSSSLSRPDQEILRQASLSAAHLSPVVLTRRLARDPLVSAARLGPDDATIEIDFRDGPRADILTGSLPPDRRQIHARPLIAARDLQPVGRALVLEPFATDQMGAHDGDTAVADLTAGGLQVSELLDQDVTLNVMSSLWQYNVVYMHTHAGVNPEGYAVVATGQVADDDPQVAPLIQEGSVMVVGVSGSSTQYYGILIPYMYRYWQQFPAHALLYIDTCELLRAGPFWQALSAKGVGALVSWDDESSFLDETAAARLFLDRMAGGASVAEAVQAVHAAGLDTSTVAGKVGHFGYLGDGYVTLQGREPGAPAVTPTTVASTPVPTAPPSSAPAPTSLPPLTVHLLPAVAPGQDQVVTVTGSPDAPVTVRVLYPNGDNESGTTRLTAGGLGSFRFRQTASRILHDLQTASVLIVAGSPSASSEVRVSYRILFGPIDVSVEPRVERAGNPVEIWTHTSSRRAVTVAIRAGGRTISRLHMHSGRNGWAHHLYQLPPSAHVRSGERAAVVVSAGPFRSRTTFEAQ